jgi:hypothetical protein
MTNYSYILFNQSPQQLRQLGARGGRATVLAGAALYKEGAQSV